MAKYLVEYKYTVKGVCTVEADYKKDVTTELIDVDEAEEQFMGMRVVSINEYGDAPEDEWDDDEWDDDGEYDRERDDNLVYNNK